jgi:putative hemolysin
VNSTLINVAIILALIMLEGLFVAAEISLVSLREGQLRAMTDRGDRRARAVAKLVADPNRFLAAVQLGVTLTALLSSAFGAVTVSRNAEDALVHAGMVDWLATTVGIVGVTLVISFVTLVLGELAPKRIGLQRAEATARAVGPTLDRLAILVRPVIWLLSRTTNGVVRLLGGDPKASREAITEEELRDLVAAHESLGRDERQLIDDVFAAGSRQLREVMLPRTEVTFLEARMTVSRAARIAWPTGLSRFPVISESYDDVVGFVHIRDLLNPRVRGDRALTVAEVAREVERLPGSKRVLAALSEMRRGGHHLAIVVDEYGGTAGIVTLEDLVEEIVGDIRDEYDVADDQAAGTDGVVEVPGLLNLDEFAERTGCRLPDGPYETAGGYVLARLGRLAQVGDQVRAGESLITVVELDGRRVSRLRVLAAPPAVDLNKP